MAKCVPDNNPNYEEAIRELEVIQVQWPQLFHASLFLMVTAVMETKLREFCRLFDQKRATGQAHKLLEVCDEYCNNHVVGEAIKLVFAKRDAIAHAFGDLSLVWPYTKDRLQGKSECQIVDGIVSITDGDVAQAIVDFE